MPRRRPAPKHGRRSIARGTTLVEALIAFLVLSFSLAALARIQADLRLGAETTRERAEAVRIAEAEFERLRSFASITAAGAGRAYADVVPATRTVGAAPDGSGGGAFTVDRAVRAAGVASAREVTVTVRWQNRAGTDQRVVIASMIAANDPALGAALALMPAGPASASHP